MTDVVMIGWGLLAASFGWWRTFSRDRKPGERLVAVPLALIYTAGLVAIFIVEVIRR